jgi:hypothetical protein
MISTVKTGNTYKRQVQPTPTSKQALIRPLATLLETAMTIDQMQKMYDDITAFKDAMRVHACNSAFSDNSFYDEYRVHADNMCEALGILSANITFKKIKESVYE